MLDVNLIFKIGAVGVLLIILDKILKTSGKDDIAAITNLAGIIIILMMLLTLIKNLFDSVKTMFSL